MYKIIFSAGFYDVAVCEKYSKLDVELRNLKDLSEKYLSYLNMEFVKLNEFNKAIQDIETWLNDRDAHGAVRNTSVDSEQMIHLDLSNLNESFQINEAIDVYKMRIENLEKLYEEYLQVVHAQNGDDIKSKFKYLLNNFVRLKLNEVKLRLSVIEKYMNRKLERSVHNLKDYYNSKIKKIKKIIQLQVNFLNKGEMTTLHQFKNAIETIREEKMNLDKVENEMHEKFKEFEKDERCVISLAAESMPGFNLDLDELVNKSSPIIFKWKQFDNHVNNFDCEFNRIHSNLIDMDLYLTSVQNESGFSTKFEVVRCEEKLNENFVSIKFDRLNDILIDMDNETQFLYNSFENLNTKNQLNKNLDRIRDQYKSLLKFSEGVRSKSNEFFGDYKAFIEMSDSAMRLINESNEIINAFEVHSNNNDLHQMKRIEDRLKRIESEIRLIVDKCPQFNITSSVHVENLYKLVNACEDQLGHIKSKQLKLVDILNEKKYRFKVKLADIETFLNYTKTRYDGLMNKIDLTSNSRVTSNFDQYIELLADIQANSKKILDFKMDLDLMNEQRKQSNQDGDSDDDADWTRVSLGIKPFLEFIDFMSSSDYLATLHEFNDVIKRILKHEDHTAGQPDHNKFNSEDLKFLFNRFNNLKTSILIRLSDDISYLNKRKLLEFIENCEWTFNEILLSKQSQKEKMLDYRRLAIEIDTRLNCIEEKLSLRENNPSQLIEIDETNFDFKKFEQHFAYYVKLKNSLNCDALRKKLNFLYELGCDLERMRRHGAQTPVDDVCLEKSPDYEALRVKHLELTSRLDNRLKELESEFANWKYIAKKSRRLLELTTFNYKQLKQVTDKHKNFKQYKIIENQKELLAIINKLKYEILESMFKNSYIKEEILDLIKKVNLKPTSIQNLVEKIIANWNTLIEKVKKQIVKYESLNKKISNLDLSLSKLEDKIKILETYLIRDFYKDLHLKTIDSKHIAKKQAELKSFLKTLHKQNASVFSLLDYTKLNLCNGDMIKGLNDRWSDLKRLISDKQLELESLFLSVQDLNEQIEKCHVALNKTETVFLNSYNDNNLKFISNLYLILNDDYKLIKYLNESYMKAVKAFGETLFNEDNFFKEKIYAVDKRWDYLHNTIAIKIKTVVFTDSSLILAILNFAGQRMLYYSRSSIEKFEFLQYCAYFGSARVP
jgi:hypothetical protein